MRVYLNGITDWPAVGGNFKGLAQPYLCVMLTFHFWQLLALWGIAALGNAGRCNCRDISLSGPSCALLSEPNCARKALFINVEQAHSSIQRRDLRQHFDAVGARLVQEVTAVTKMVDIGLSYRIL